MNYLQSNRALMPLLHGVLISIVLIIVATAPGPLKTSLMQWDVLWYDTIRTNGYEFNPDGMSNVAFFPLFPTFWRLSHLSALGISLVNLAITIGALILLRRYLQLRLSALMLFVALPSSFFLFMPYTEAFFFLIASLVLIAMTREHRVGQGVAMLVGALTRVSALYFLPALWVVEGLAAWQEPSTTGSRIRRVFWFSVLTGIGLLCVILIQWSQTGVWMAFSKVQGKGWDRYLRVPHLPFVSAGNHVLWLDGLSLMVGLAAGAWAVWAIVRVLRRQGPAPKPIVMFSAVFIATVTLHILFYAPIRQGGSTSIMSLNRYILCNPFFLILLNEFLPNQALSWRRILLLLLPVIVLLGTLGMLSGKQFVIQLSPFGPLPGLLYGLLVLFYVLPWFFSGTRRGWALLYCVSLLIQLGYLYAFTIGRWIG